MRYFFFENVIKKIRRRKNCNFISRELNHRKHNFSVEMLLWKESVTFFGERMICMKNALQ